MQLQGGTQMKEIAENVNLMPKAAVKNPGERGTVVLYRYFGA